MLLVVIGEFLVFLAGVATGVFFRAQISACIRGLLGWVRSTADDAEKRL